MSDDNYSYTSDFEKVLAAVDAVRASQGDPEEVQQSYDRKLYDALCGWLEPVRLQWHQDERPNAPARLKRVKQVSRDADGAIDGLDDYWELSLAPGAIVRL